MILLFYTIKSLLKQEKIGNLDMYPHEDIKIGYVYKKMGLHKEASSFIQLYSLYCQKDESIYQPASLAGLYAYQGKLDQAIEQLKVFSLESNYQYWILMFMEVDPVFKPLKEHPEFNDVIQKIKDRFWENKSVLKLKLQEEGLL